MKDWKEDLRMSMKPVSLVGSVPHARLQGAYVHALMLITNVSSSAWKPSRRSGGALYIPSFPEPHFVGASGFDSA